MDDGRLSQLAEALAEALGRVEEYARAVRADSWNDRIQTGDGAWTRRQLLSHMAANDLRQLIRIRLGAGIPAPGDEEAHAAELLVDEWNGARVAERADRDVDQLLAEMRMNRAALIELIRGLTPEQRDRPMPFRGRPTPLEDMVAIVIAHLDQHGVELTSAPAS